MDTKLIIILVLLAILITMFICEYSGKSQKNQEPRSSHKNQEPFNSCGCQKTPMIGLSQRTSSINGPGPSTFITGREQPMVISSDQKRNEPFIIVPSQNQMLKPILNGPILNAPVLNTPILDTPISSAPLLNTPNGVIINHAKTDTAEPGIIKFMFYHMNGCGHCSDFMKVPKINGRTKFETLAGIFANDPMVKIVDFQYGRDKEANKFTAFPMIYIASEAGTQEYNGPLEVDDIVKAINRHK